MGPFVDDLGSEVAVAGRPQRIVTLVPSISETLATWGVVPVGVTDWCVEPEFPDAVRVRGTKNPDVPTIIGLAPDLVVADQEENRLVDVERLRAAGVPVYVTAPRSLDDVATTLERLGHVVGAPENAAALADAIRAAIAVRPDRQLRTFCPVWRDPWIAVGTGTVVGDLLHRAGFEVVPAIERYPRVDIDEVARHRPDVVLLPDEPYEFGADDARGFSDWGVPVHLVDGRMLTWWGPRTPGALAMLRELAERSRPQD
jgi:ABC-type Fe3+-hydroxamate transport system substrate-binding protein